MKTSNLSADKPTIRPCSHKELANMYQMDKRTITRWLKPHQHLIGLRIGRFYTVKQVITIFEVLGLPDCFDQR